MSTIRLKKDWGKHTAKSVISAPFTVAADLIRQGLAELAQDPVPVAIAKPAAATEADRHAAEIARLNALRTSDLAALREEHAEAVKKLGKEHEAAVKKLAADLDTANATITELQANKGGKK